MAKKLRCYLGLHRWQSVHVDDGGFYRECRDCGKVRLPPEIQPPISGGGFSF
jgi:hypothetical protein